MLAGTPQDCAYGVSLQAAAFTRKPTSAALRLFALCASRLTAHQSWRRLDCSALRCAAESVPPSAIGSLLTAFPKRIRLATLHRVSASQVPLTPDASHSASPMLDKSLLNAYGEPVHTHSLSLHLPSPSGSQEDEFLPDRRQTALRSVAGGEPHALLYGSSFCAKAFAPVKGKGHSHHTAANLRLVSLSLFAPVAAHANKCLFGQRSVNTSSYVPPTAPDVAGQLHYGCVRRAQSVEKV